MTSQPSGPPPPSTTGYHDKPASYWQRIPFRSDTGGVSPLLLEGREKFMKERMRGMTPEQRARRKQFLQDQILTAREPVDVPQIYTELNNPIKRFYHYPFRKIELALVPKLGDFFANKCRWFIQHAVYSIFLTYAATYYFMYCTHDWTHWRNGLEVRFPKPTIFPGDPNYPFTSTKKFDDYYSWGFKDSVLYKTNEQVRAEETVKSQ